MGALRRIPDIRRSNYSGFRPANRWFGGQYAETVDRFHESARIARGDQEGASSTADEIKAAAWRAFTIMPATVSITRASCFDLI